jgi:hypothetical protein
METVATLYFYGTGIWYQRDHAMLSHAIQKREANHVIVELVSILPNMGHYVFLLYRHTVKMNVGVRRTHLSSRFGKRHSFVIFEIYPFSFYLVRPLESPV